MCVIALYDFEIYCHLHSTPLCVFTSSTSSSPSEAYKMSSRALRKLQKEQELQKLVQAAEDAQQDHEESEDEEEPEPPTDTPKPQNAFDMLEDVHESEGSAEDHETSRTQPESTQNASTQQPKSTPQTKSKKKKKKSKKKAKDHTDQPIASDTNNEDEIDRALRELAVNQTPQETDGIAPTSKGDWESSATKLLAIDSRQLNPMNEMRSLFGSVATEESEPRNSPRPQRRREVNQQGGVDLATGLTGRYNMASGRKELGSILAKRRNVFMQGREEWPLTTSGGLSMEHLASDQAFEKKYSIVHNQRYQEMQGEFRQTVESMDPRRMIYMLQVAPYHIQSLLQVSEIAKHQGDHSVCGDLLERALFNFGRSVHSSFPMALREGKVRLSFDKPANRELYLTIWRYIRNLEMRGTWKTAFEWSKVLLQLDTLTDPYGVTMMIDQLALRGRCHDQLLRLTSDEAYGSWWRHLPNIQISLSLAHLRAKQSREARQQLAIAMTQYPYILSALASALDISPLPKALWAKLPSSDAEKLHTELYITRAKDLWNTPETSALLVEVAETLDHYKSYTANIEPDPKLEISFEEARHVMLLEIPPLIALLPRKFTSRPSFSFDILPPPSSEEDFVRRAPAGATDSSAPSMLGNLFSALGGAAGGAAGTASNVIGNLMTWLNTPANGAAQGQNPEQALQNLEEIFGQEIPPEMLNEIIDLQLTENEDNQNRITPQGLGIPVPGEWDHYEDLANAPSDSNEDSMPELEDIPTQETRPTSAPTPPPQAPRNPLAPTIEEDASDNESGNEQLLGPRRPMGRAVLHHVDSDEEDEAAVDSDGIAPHPTSPTHTLYSARPAMQFEPNRESAARPLGRSTSASQPQVEVDAEEQIEQDPQRLQRWLLTSGLAEVQSGQEEKVGLYVRRLRMLRKQQQGWILQMVGQRGESGKDVVERVRARLGE